MISNNLFGEFDLYYEVKEIYESLPNNIIYAYEENKIDLYEYNCFDCYEGNECKEKESILIEIVDILHIKPANLAILTFP